MNDHSQLTQKSAVLYSKTGPAIYHSHHDMIRFWERAVRRAGLPMRLTQGFNPRPRMVFPHALGLGIASLHEEVELELCSRLATGEMKERLVKAVAGALDIAAVLALPPVKKSRQLIASAYRIEGWPAEAAGKLGGVAAAVAARPDIMVERGKPGETRSLDIRPHIARIAYEADGNQLVFELRHTQAGSARPDEIAKLAAGAVGLDWRDLRIVKTAMTLT